MMKNSIPAELSHGARRLKRITGFATTLYSNNDIRPLFFCRYNHVIRVAWTAHWLVDKRTEVGDNIDRKRVNWLAWVHDLNRWPFAHNSEKNENRRFDQAKDCPIFFQKNKIKPPFDIYGDLTAIINRTPDRLSPEGSIVLLADIAAGFIEDPMMAIIGLNLTPNIIPEKVQNILGFPVHDDSFLTQLLELNKKFFMEKSGDSILNRFNSIFRKRVVHFLRFHELDKYDKLNTEWFENIRYIVKERFLREQLFPYNNEKIANGELIKEKLIYPLSDDYINKLTEWDEPEFIEFALKEKLIRHDEVHFFLPDLDYISREEPEKRFRIKD